MKLLTNSENPSQEAKFWDRFREEKLIPGID
jgi:hypothetical protein